MEPWEKRMSETKKRFKSWRAKQVGKQKRIWNIWDTMKSSSITRAESREREKTGSKYYLERKSTIFMYLITLFPTFYPLFISYFFSFTPVLHNALFLFIITVLTSKCYSYIYIHNTQHKFLNLLSNWLSA